VELTPGTLTHRYAHLLASCEPFVVTYPGNLGALDLSPFGKTLAPERVYDPTRLASSGLIDALHRLDAFTFGGASMVMPRWVLFDCGEFPGIVFGFGRRARGLGPVLRRAYQVEHARDDETFVPLSMWVAIRCVEEGAWFGHNLSSCNVVAAGEAMPGLGTLTKAYGVRLARCAKQYGATQWDSNSIAIHMALGEMNLLGAWTPAHTYPESFSYRIDVDPARLAAPLGPGWQRPKTGGDRAIDVDDVGAIRALHGDIEAGARYRLHRVEHPPGGPQRIWLISVGAPG
jgi:hypothetical protein